MDDWSQKRSVTIGQLAKQLLSEPQLLLRLIGELTVSETHFFRHQAHFDFLVSVAQHRLTHSANHYRVLSAGCATGEEPYSIALALQVTLPIGVLDRVSITGIDVNREAIATAEEAVYGAWSFRGVQPRWLNSGFRRLSDGRHQLLPQLRKLVTFRCAVLQEQLLLLPAECLDAIFFRNVSVYLTQQANDTIYAGFARVMRPNGHLFVAPSDVRPATEQFQRFQGQDATIFQRASLSDSNEVFPHLTQVSRHQQPGSEAFPLGCVDSSSDRVDAANWCNRNDWHQADAMAEDGELAVPVSHLTARIDTDDASPEVFLQRARLHLANNDARSAVEEFRRVLYLTPNDCAVRYWYALALHEAGQLDAARHQLSVILGDRAACNDGLYSTVASLMGELT